MAHIVRESLRILFVVGTVILPIFYWLLGRVDQGIQRRVREKGKGGANSKSHGEEHRTGPAAKLEPLGKKVQPGDTLSDLAERFGTSVESIAQSNGIEDPNVIFADQILYLSRRKGAGPQT